MITKDNADTVLHGLSEGEAPRCPHCLYWSGMIQVGGDGLRMHPDGMTTRTSRFVCEHCLRRTTIGRTGTVTGPNPNEPELQFFLRDESEASDGA